MRWSMRSLVLMTALVLTGAADARGDEGEGCEETIERGGYTALLVGDSFVTSSAAANAVLIERVGQYRLDDGAIMRLTCEAWLVVVVGTDVRVLPIQT